MFSYAMPYDRHDMVLSCRIATDMDLSLSMKMEKELFIVNME